MLKKVLSDFIYNIIEKSYGFNNVNEIRMRTNKPITVSCNGQVYYLNNAGLSLKKDNAIIASKNMIDNIIYKASEYSIYSVNEEIKQGFIVLKSGERIGICGSFVMDGAVLKTITNFTSINIRIPHEIRNCSLKVFDKLVENGCLKNCLIISPPGQGKTTFIRDFVYQLSNKNFLSDVLIIDERGEIAGKDNAFDLGDFCDVITFSTKYRGFIQGIRAMNPKLIVTDELGDKEDFDAINYAANCGVNILATIHADSINQLKNKPYFSIIQSVFERYVVFEKFAKAGTIQGVYDKNFNKL